MAAVTCLWPVSESTWEDVALLRKTPSLRHGLLAYFDRAVFTVWEVLTRLAGERSVALADGPGRVRSRFFSCSPYAVWRVYPRWAGYLWWLSRPVHGVACPNSGHFIYGNVAALISRFAACTAGRWALTGAGEQTVTCHGGTAAGGRQAACETGTSHAGSLRLHPNVARSDEEGTASFPVVMHGYCRNVTVTQYVMLMASQLIM